MIKKRLVSTWLAIMLVISCVLSSGTGAVDLPVYGETPTLHTAAISPATQAASLADTFDVDETAVVLSAEDVPELVGTENITSHGHIIRLRAQEKDLNTAVFSNNDGTITEYVFSEPIKYVDTDGTVKDKHVLLELERGEYRNTANNDIAFSASQDAAQGTTLAYNGTSLCVVPIFLGGRSALSRAENGNIRYSGTDDLFTYTVMPHINGAEYHVTIQSGNSSDTFAFEIAAYGLELAVDATDNIRFENPEAKAAYSLTLPIITDANGRFAFCNVSINGSGRGSYIFTVDASSLANDSNIRYPLDITYSVNVMPSTFDSFVSVNLYSQPYGGTVSYLLLGHLGDVNNSPVYGMSQLRMTDFTNRLYFYNDCNLISATLNLYCQNNNLLSFMSAYINGFAGYTGGVIDYNNVVLDNTVPAAHENSIYPGSYTAFDVLDFMKYWRKSSNAAQNGWIASVVNLSGYSVYFTSPSGTSSQRPYLTLTYSPRVNLKIPSNEYIIYNGVNNCAIKHFDSGSALTLVSKDVTSPLQRMYIELYSATGATYTIKDPQGNRYLTVNTNKQVYFNSAPATGPQDSQLWYIVQLSDGSVQFWPKQYDGHALSYIPGSMIQFEVTTDVDDAKTKWRLQSYRIWYSQVSSQNSWDATNLNHVYFTGYLSEFVMQDNTSGDLMDTGCVMCSVAMVLRNMDKIIYGIDYRNNDWYINTLWSDPFTVIMSNCLVDFSNNVVPDAYGNIELTRGTGVGYPTSYIGENIEDRFNVNIERIGYPTKNYIKNQLASHPEGICVHFVKNGKKHMIVVLDYDEDADNGNGDFIVCDPGTSNPTKGNKVYFKNSRTYTDKGMDFANAAFCLIFS